MYRKAHLISTNPFLAPADDVSGEMSEEYLSPYAQIRTAHVLHELAIKLVGWCYLLSALCGLVLVLLSAAAMTRGVQVPADLYLVMVVMALCLLMTSWGLICLKPWSRWMALIYVVSNTGLLIVNQATGWLNWIWQGINFCTLVLMISAKSGMIFSEEYREIIRQTRHIKWRPPRWLVFIVVNVVIVSVIVWAAFIWL